jgi:hypothetical protein
MFNFFKRPRVVVYNNGGYGLNFKNDAVIKSILNETKEMHKLAEAEEEKNKTFEMKGYNSYPLYSSKS